MDYGGSTGYGRAVRRELDGAWGIVDVDDCVAAADALVERGAVDPDADGDLGRQRRRLHDARRAGVPRPVRGRDQLCSAWPTSSCSPARRTSSNRATWTGWSGPIRRRSSATASRSPIHAFDRIAVPVLVLQGLEDRVVVPAEAEAIVAALAANGIPYAYLAFEGEGHGFRGETAIRRSIEAELSFLAQVFGFEPADTIEPVTLAGLDAWRVAPGRERGRRHGLTRPARPWTPRPRSSSSCCCWSSRLGLAYLARRIGIAVPDRPGARRPRARARPRRGSATSRRSSCRRRSSSCCSCRRSCSGPGYDTPIRDFKANLRAIGLLAIGLVLFTAIVGRGRRERPDPRASAGGRRSPSAPSWRRRTPWRRPRSSAAWACRRGS